MSMAKRSSTTVASYYNIVIYNEIFELKPGAFGAIPTNENSPQAPSQAATRLRIQDAATRVLLDQRALFFHIAILACGANYA